MTNRTNHTTSRAGLVPALVAFLAWMALFAALGRAFALGLADMAGVVGEVLS